MFSSSVLALKLPGADAIKETVSSVKQSPSSASSVRSAKNPIAGRYIVVLQDGLNANRAVKTLLQPLGLKPDLVFDTVLNGFALNTSPALAEKLANMQGVRYVEEDAIVKKSATPWGLDRVDQASLPLDGEFTPANDGKDVHVYIIDTGIRASHAEFKDRVGEGYNVAGSSPGMFDILGPVGDVLGGLLGGGGNDGDTSNPEDCNGHGTHVAGTVVGSSYGIARRATVHAVRVLDCQGSGSTSGVIEGVEWVTEKAQKPAVVNMSLGGGASSALDEAVAKSIKTGLFYAVAAGNEDSDACGSSPAREPSAFTVGSTDKTDTRSSFSNKGKCVDIFAPGSDIISAWHTGDSANKTISGTSMASPHVAGVAALYLQEHPDASPQDAMTALSKLATQDKVKDPSGSSNRLLQGPAAAKKPVPAKPPADKPQDQPSETAAPPANETAPPAAAPPAQGTSAPTEQPAQPSPSPTAAPQQLGHVSLRVQCTGVSCEFFTEDAGSDARYQWQFGDGMQSSERETSYLYPSPEDYKVQLTVTTAQGQRSSAFSLEVGTANKPCSDCQAAQGVIASGDSVYLPAFTTTQERDVMAWLRGKSDSYHRAFLQRQDGSNWKTVGQSFGDDDDQVLIANDSAAGTYRFRLSSGSDGMGFQAWTRAK